MIEITNNYKTFTDLNPIYPDIIICEHVENDVERLDLKTQIRIFRENVWYKVIYRSKYTSKYELIEAISRFIEQIYKGQVYSDNLKNYCKPDLEQISEEDRIRRDYDNNYQTKSS